MRDEHDDAQLRDGAEWPEHEDCIIGNEKGLQNLMRACEVALGTGEYRGTDLGEWVGVKKLESTWFAQVEEATSSKLGSVLLAIFAILVAFLAIVGLVTLVTLLLVRGIGT